MDLYSHGIPPPSTTNPYVARGEAASTPTSVSGGRQYSIRSRTDESNPETSKVFAEAALQIAAETLRAIHKDPIWKEIGGIDAADLTKRIASTKAQVEKLEFAIDEAEKQLSLSIETLDKKTYLKLSNKCREMKAELLSLQASLKLYQDFQTNEAAQQALEIARNTQEWCQKLSRLSRHHATVSPELLNEGAELKRQLEGSADNPLTKQILEEASKLLQETLASVIPEIERHNPLMFRRAEREKFKGEKSQVIQQLTQLSSGGQAQAVRRLTTLGRLFHQQEGTNFEHSLNQLNAETSKLLEKVAAGKATDEEKQILSNLHRRLQQTEERYQNIRLVIGNQAALQQFRERAICQISIQALRNRITAVSELLTDQHSSTLQKAAAITQQIGIALGEQGQKQAEAFYSACSQLETLEQQARDHPPKNELAKSLLDAKIAQLITELESASAHIFSRESKTYQAEKASAEKMAASVALTSKEREQALSFLTKAMTRLTMFTEDADLRATVDLCLGTMDEATKDLLPKDLVSRYQKTTGPEKNRGEWQKKITRANALIQQYKVSLSKRPLEMQDLNALVQCAKDLKALDLFTDSARLLATLQTEIPVELTTAERKALESPPTSPSPEEQKAIEIALTKLMFLALHSPNPTTRDTAKKKVLDFLNTNAFKLEYQSLITSLRQQAVIQEFVLAQLPSIGVKMEALKKTEGAIGAVRDIFNTVKNPWIQTLLTPASLGIPANGDVLTYSTLDPMEVEQYIKFRQDIALLKNQKLAQRERSWEGVVQLREAHDRANNASSLKYQSEYDSCLATLRAAQSSLNTWAGTITEDKRKLAHALLAEKPRFQEKIHLARRLSLRVSQDKRSERIDEMLGPLLYQACCMKPPRDEDLVEQLPHLLLKLYEQDPTIFQKPSQILPLLKLYCDTHPKLVPDQVKSDVQNIPLGNLRAY